MKPDALRNAYEAFFVKSEAGRFFVAELDRQIAANHDKAEIQPEQARDFVQRAKGVRDVRTHIDSVVIEIRKGRATPV